jgi:tetratricopeptide (TPR) repeat protein
MRGFYAQILAPFVVYACLAATPAFAAQPDTDRLERCLAKAETQADAAYEDGLIWLNQGGGALASQCVAVATIGQGRVEEGAQRLFDLAFASDAGTEAQRAELLAKAGNAWLLTGNAANANASLSKAIEMFPTSGELRLDRARALVLLGEWAAAEADLDLTIGKNPADPLALRLRAEARLEQGKLDLAQADVERALEIDGKDVSTLVLRGSVREAQRLKAKAGS